MDLWIKEAILQGAVTALAGIVIATFAFKLSRDHQKENLAASIVDALASLEGSLHMAIEHFMAAGEPDILHDEDGNLVKDEDGNIAVKWGLIDLGMMFRWPVDFSRLRSLVDSAGLHLGLIGADNLGLLRQVTYRTEDIRTMAARLGITLTLEDTLVEVSGELDRDPRQFSELFEAIRKSADQVSQIHKKVAGSLGTP